MAWGWRCDIGCESWPDKVLYKQCPRCGTSCTRFSNLNVIDEEDAERELQAALTAKRNERETRALHAKFEAYYSDRCTRLGVPVNGPLSDKDLAKIPSPS